MKESDYWDLISRHIAGKTSADEEVALKKWLQESNEHKRIYELQKELWKFTPDPQRTFKVDKGWTSVTQRIESDNQRKRIAPYIFKIAASLLIFILVGYFLISFIDNSQNMTVIKAPSDKVTEVLLPDNSVVWLNRNSTLKYNEDYNLNDREVFLDGEAFF